MKKTGSDPISFLALALLLMLPAAASNGQSEASQSVRDRLIGVYTLARYSAHGDHPTGRISYDSAGRMWAMLLPPGRKPLTRESTPEDYRNTMRGVVAYYGTYEIDEASGRVIHHVEAASNPAWIGDDFVRWFRFEGSDLVISLNPRFENTLLWKRLPDGPEGQP
ncbi:MAG TPA: lipocalin-like domain-containing protein [Gammaproteobacteria bacterium]|nr:lipocalin-like domain-containing protein [Gammaproteobacteria bacterium]